MKQMVHFRVDFTDTCSLGLRNIEHPDKRLLPAIGEGARCELSVCVVGPHEPVSTSEPAARVVAPVTLAPNTTMRAEPRRAAPGRSKQTYHGILEMKSLWFGAVLAVAAGATLAAEHYFIPAEPLNDALVAWSLTTAHRPNYGVNGVKGIGKMPIFPLSNPIEGDFGPQHALCRLLQGMGLPLRTMQTTTYIR